MKARYQSLQLSTSKIEGKNTELVEGMQDLKEELNQVKEQNIELNKRIEQDEKLNDEADENFEALQRNQRHAEMDIASLQ